MQTDVLHKGTPLFNRGAAPREERRFEWGWIVIAICVAITVYLALVPLGFLLASPKIGIINLALKAWLGIEQPLFDIYSMAGMIWVDGLHYSPMAFLLMSAAFRSMDPSLEESAMMSGANVFQVAWRVTLR